VEEEEEEEEEDALASFQPTLTVQGVLSMCWCLLMKFEVFMLGNTLITLILLMIFIHLKT
jgi:hypothetical protein